LKIQKRWVERKNSTKMERKLDQTDIPHSTEQKKFGIPYRKYCRTARDYMKLVLSKF
jgi:hypothetical protein